MEEAGVADRGAANSRDTWEEQISRMAPAIHYFLRKRYSLSDDVAWDLTHDTIVAALEAVRKPGFELNAETQLATFVHGIAKHKAADYFKHQRVRRHPSLDDEKNKFSSLAEPEPGLPEMDSGKLRVFIERLPQPQGHILYLMFFKGYKVREVSREMKIEATQVSTLKFTAIKQLRVWCEEEGLSPAILLVAAWNLWRLIHGL